MNIPHERLIDIAMEAAPRLSGDWRYNNVITQRRSGDWQKFAIISDKSKPGRLLVLREHWKQRSRIEISGELPRISGSSVRTENSITVSPTRSGRSIAGDINRRFIPDYLALWEKAVAEVGRQRRDNDNFTHRYQLLCSLLPGLKPMGQNVTSTCDFRWHDDNLSAQIRMFKTYGRTQIELSLSFDQLVQVCSLVSSLRQTR